VLEYPIKGDVALIGAWRSDGMGNLVYRKTARNFGPVMAAAARTTIVEVPQVVATGELDPEVVVTPGIYVDRVVDLSRAVDLSRVGDLGRTRTGERGTR
jgi:3-oxoadipate CoA-transferase alpha subunit